MFRRLLKRRLPMLAAEGVLAGAIAGVLAMLLAAASSPAFAAGPEVISRTQHEGRFGGRAVRYTALVERTAIALPSPGPSGQVVSTAYLADRVDGAAGDPARRPVLFLFNGGPIVPSVYLHMMAFGPRRVAVPDDLGADPAGFRLVDNPDTVLDRADLVFFDPVGTGYSRATPPSTPRDFFSVDADAQEFVAFARQWAAAHGREASPKFLFGESYGTVRAAAVARRLATGTPALRLDGVFLFGQGLNIVETVQRPANLMSYVVSLPTLAALGWHHGKVRREGRSFEAFVDEARRFARDEYLPALYLGQALPASRRQALARRLEALTGLPAARFEALDLRVSKMRYRAELLADRGLVLGMYDGRYTAPAAASGPLPDGSEVLFKAAHAAFAEHAKQSLGLDLTEPYITDSAVKSFSDWQWGGSAPFDDWPFMAWMREAMEKNPRLRLVLGNGYADTLTTVGAAEQAVAQAGWPRDRLTQHYYEGGHMAYSIERSLRALMTDVRAMLDAADKDPSP
ncbi:hypothetical protein [Mitsuaria sp. GD03876]|uniref:S10 family peptidase n=1 Tax=Mitsuaria sp. GD03876 TaxID=2975399 RepID=UPI00244B9296|nr:hypothetical protein [Mitsuaria sp. GD03876]MDH0867343.1 hypothetical protein [Mitsuaria sp. GD03876]